MHEFEKKIVIKMNSRRSKFADFFSKVVSNVFFLSSMWIVVPIIIASHDFPKGLLLGAGLALAFGLNFLISDCLIKIGGRIFSIKRLRPHVAYPKEVRAVGKSMIDSSFPSSHVAAMVAGLVVLVNFFPFLWTFAIVVVLLTGWSRMYNGMHYPSDILAGIILGLAYGSLVLFALGLAARYFHGYI